MDMNFPYFSYLYRFILYCLMLITLAGILVPVVNSQRMHFGRKLDVYAIKTITTVSVDSCMNECNKRISCGSINFHRLRTLCELCPKMAKEHLNLSTAPGYMFQMKTAGHIDDCNNSCGPGKVCKGDNKCKASECEEMHVTYGIIKGNMNNIDSKLLVQCSQGYDIEQPLATASCEQSGWWTNGNERICKKICEIPEDIYGGVWEEIDFVTLSGHLYTVKEIDDLLNETILSGSSASYRCKENLQMYGPASIECVEGEWSTPPVCFYKPCWLEKDALCPEGNLSCSDVMCNCMKEVGNFSVRLCDQNCHDELDWFPETNGTTQQPDEEVVIQRNASYISPARCEQICRRARDISCESLNPKRFDVDLFGNSLNSTCMLWSSSFRDQWTEKAWWTEASCPFKLNDFD